MHKYYIDKIVSSGDNKKMEALKELLVDTITSLKTIDYSKYEDVECKLYEIVEGKKLTEEKAKEWVSSMNPPAKWTIDEIKQVKESTRTDIPLPDFYALMNMLYSDYNDTLEDNVDIYVKLAKDWYYDRDVKMEGSEKLYCYWKHFGRYGI